TRRTARIEVSIHDDTLSTPRRVSERLQRSSCQRAEPTPPVPGELLMTANIRFNFSMALAAAVLAAGCEPAAPPAAKAPVTPVAIAKDNHGHSHKRDGGHGHGAGPHEGTLADWGGGKFHIEFNVDHDQQEATVYVLGSDEKTPAPIKATDGKLLLTITEP